MPVTPPGALKNVAKVVGSKGQQLRLDAQIPLVEQCNAFVASDGVVAKVDPVPVSLGAAGFVIAGVAPAAAAIFTNPLVRQPDLHQRY